MLSNVYLAMQVVNDKRYKIRNKDLRMILNQVSQFTNMAGSLAPPYFGDKGYQQFIPGFPDPLNPDVDRPLFCFSSDFPDQ